MVSCYLLHSAYRVAVPSRPARGQPSTVNDSVVLMMKRTSACQLLLDSCLTHALTLRDNVQALL